MRILFLTLVLAFAAQSASAGCSWPGYYSTPEEKCTGIFRNIGKPKPVEQCIDKRLPKPDHQVVEKIIQDVIRIAVFHRIDHCK